MTTDLTDRNLIENLLAELRYVLTTGNIPDSEKNSREVRESAAARIGYESYSAFEESCNDDAGSTNADQEMAEGNGLHVRHDMGGFYICTDEEADHEDEGHASVGFDGREHWPTEGEAWTAAAETAIG